MSEDQFEDAPHVAALLRTLAEIDDDDQMDAVDFDVAAVAIFLALVLIALGARLWG